MIVALRMLAVGALFVVPPIARAQDDAHDKLVYSPRPRIPTDRLQDNRR